MTDKKNKVAVITGAANGLGKALATEFYKQGTVLHCRRHPPQSSPPSSIPTNSLLSPITCTGKATVACPYTKQPQYPGFIIQ
jgi:NAD(P)-dependent dehydrogenase (short-subunit alcohol dehydrogenase family)